MREVTIVLHLSIEPHDPDEPLPAIDVLPNDRDYDNLADALGLADYGTLVDVKVDVVAPGKA